MNDLPNWLGDLPTWITTAAIGIAALQYRSERRRRSAEEDRESKAQASRLCAWVAHDKTSEGGYGKRGIVIANTSGSTFHDVTIEAQIHKNKPVSVLNLVMLPPGHYYAEHQGDVAAYQWAFPDPIEPSGSQLRPYMKSSDYLVKRIDFRDALGQQWRTDERFVLSSP
ncbi:hypothetical protein [Arthrobacter bambusae]|uniref:Uncharacterized protein n=1 Tax=Arthrobacter bambusae TaxID=1338426 RepID=A0AAW8DE36_9MICC|nr:hypothetical protein [Arthrobacter bambusae]MDP9904545.1 hypothetical protein [Arthrobacter bambusae]MDQ0129360.1 hypothetical protein [Arthrobacter bambusae]MDQ0181027.1 hypothetical protein [Arthrobacter bambusae]